MSGLDPLVGVHEIGSPADMQDLGERMGRMLRPGELVVLTGPLGAGKTTLTRGIAVGLGVRGPVQSPTFVIARTHPSLVQGPPLVHVDAYRLGSAPEFDDLDIDYDRSVVVAEWAAPFASAIAEEWWEVELDRDVPRAPGAAATGAESATQGGVAGTEGSVWDDEAELDADAPRRVTISRRP